MPKAQFNGKNLFVTVPQDIVVHTKLEKGMRLVASVEGRSRIVFDIVRDEERLPPTRTVTPPTPQKAPAPVPIVPAPAQRIEIPPQPANEKPLAIDGVPLNRPSLSEATTLEDVFAHFGLNIREGIPVDWPIEKKMALHHAVQRLQAKKADPSPPSPSRDPSVSRVPRWFS